MHKSWREGSAPCKLREGLHLSPVYSQRHEVIEPSSSGLRGT